MFAVEPYLGRWPRYLSGILTQVTEKLKFAQIDGVLGKGFLYWLFCPAEVKRDAAHISCYTPRALFGVDKARC